MGGQKTSHSARLPNAPALHLQ